MSRSSRIAVGALLAALLLACTTSAASARSFWVEPLFAGTWLNESPWALGNEVQVLNCDGIGPARRDAAYQSTYASFRCEAHASGDSAKLGEVLVRPIGPERMQVVRTLSGTAPPERPLGTIPRGSGPLRSAEVPSLLDRSRWARSHRYASARCYGVGRFSETTGIGSAGFSFTAFVCRTTVVEGEDHVLLVASSSGGRAVRVARVLV